MNIYKENCPICMVNLSIDTISLQPTHLLVLRQTEYNPKLKQIMQTPCKHRFHVVCLLDWMKINMICPTCRRPLPEI